MKINKLNVLIFFNLSIYFGRSVYLAALSNASKYLTKILHAETSPPIHSSLDQRVIRKVVKGTKRFSPFIRKSRRCLVEAMMVHQTLKKFGIASDFKIGTLKKNNQLEAHAWIEINGKSIVGGQISGYEELVKTH